MKRIIFFITVLALASLACLETTITSEAPQLAPTKTAIPAATDENPAGAIFDLSTWDRTPKPLCATVTAIQSLHMRAQPNEKAEVIAYLKNGEQVRVLELGAWWKIEAHGLTGYAKGKYLQEGCQ